MVKANFNFRLKRLHVGPSATVLIGVLLTAFMWVSSTLAQSNVQVHVSDLPVAERFQMPIGDTARINFGLLTIGTFVNFTYPKIRFNENGNSTPEANEWYVATAFNKNRWLNKGWNTEPDTDKNSIYGNRGAYHPGEDWNWANGGDSDLGKNIYAIADGKVLFNGSVDNYGNTLIIAHKLSNGGIITSFYAHMEARSPFQKGASIDISRDGPVGQVGKTQTKSGKADKKRSGSSTFRN